MSVKSVIPNYFPTALAHTLCHHSREAVVDGAAQRATEKEVCNHGLHGPHGQSEVGYPQLGAQGATFWRAGRSRDQIACLWGPETLSADQARDVLEIAEDRYDAGSILLTSQVPGRSLARHHR
jgi:hypothetical protein